MAATPIDLQEIRVAVLAEEAAEAVAKWRTESAKLTAMLTESCDRMRADHARLAWEESERQRIESDKGWEQAEANWKELGTKT